MAEQVVKKNLTHKVNHSLLHEEIATVYSGGLTINFDDKTNQIEVILHAGNLTKDKLREIDKIINEHNPAEKSTKEIQKGQAVVDKKNARMAARNVVTTEDKVNVLWQYFKLELDL